MSFYENLHVGYNQIRLIEVLQASPEGEDLQITIEVANLDHTVSQYYALSYTWGAPAEYGKWKAMTANRSHPVICKGKIIYVTGNLAAFLKRIRKTPWLLEKKFWVDGICIDQDNASEREQQIAMMGYIYKSADAVIAWLGEEDQFTRTAFKALERIQYLVERNLLYHSPNYLGWREDQLKLDHISDREAWLSVAKMFQRCYFIRAWVVQEIALSKRLKVICSGEEIEWETLVTTTRFFSQTGWKAFFNNLPRTYSDEALLPSYNHVAHLLNGVREDHQVQHWATTLLLALGRSRDFKTSDPRDKVYCLLGLVEDHTRDKPRLKVVYGSRTTATVYINTAIQLLEDGKDLYLLSCVEGELFQRLANGPLPSWVPDWTCGKGTGLLIAGYRRYKASGNETQRPQIDESALTLTLRGIKVDEVTMVGEAKHEVLDGKAFIRWLEIVASLPEWYLDISEDEGGEHRTEVFWRTILGNTSGSPPRTIPPRSRDLHNQFLRWMHDKMESPPNQSLNAKWEHMRRLAGKLFGPHDTMTTSERLWKAVQTKYIDFETRLAWAIHLRLFRTRSGYLGLGSECVREGDLVWIIPSSRVPLLFRPVSSRNSGKGNRWRLVGGTYLHGLMRGELFCRSCSGKSKKDVESMFETIVVE
ncbi:MAG: hypothetical protein Q9227_004847 [Pyrenula ochraceoflavens]